MAWLELTEGDTRPSRVRLTVNRKALDLTLSTVTLTMEPVRGLDAPDLRRACIVVDGPKGLVDIPWRTGDLREGVSRAKFEVLTGPQLFHVPMGDEWLDVIVGPGGPAGPASPSDGTVEALVNAEAQARATADDALAARIAALEALLP